MWKTENIFVILKIPNWLINPTHQKSGKGHKNDNTFQFDIYVLTCTQLGQIRIYLIRSICQVLPPPPPPPPLMSYLRESSMSAKLYLEFGEGLGPFSNLP